MKQHQDFKEFLKVQILDLPKNEILRTAKILGIKIRRQEGLKIIGETRGEAPRPMEIRMKYIPRKYRDKFIKKEKEKEIKKPKIKAPDEKIYKRMPKKIKPKMQLTSFQWQIWEYKDDVSPFFHSSEQTRTLKYKEGVFSLTDLIDKEVKPVMKDFGITRAYLDFEYKLGYFKQEEGITKFVFDSHTFQKEARKKIEVTL